MNDNQNITSIEGFFDKLLGTSVSAQKFMGRIPSTIKDSWNDLVLVDTSYSNDFDAYGYAMVYVCLYSRPLSDGSKNGKNLKRMTVALNELVRNSKSKTYKIERRSTFPDFDKELNWHYDVVEIKVIIL